MRILDALVVGAFLSGAASAFAQGTPPSESPAQVEAQQAPVPDAPGAMPTAAHDDVPKADEDMKPKTTGKTRTVAKTKTSKKPPSTKAKAEDPAPGDVSK
jgi:hypothetical protein